MAVFYTENEEDASISVIDLPDAKLLQQVSTPHPLAGIAISPDGKMLVAVSDDAPVVFLIDPATLRIVRTVTLDNVPKAAQIARYSPDGKVLLVTSLQSGTATLIDASFSHQTTLVVGKQPMDVHFHNGQLFVACQCDGSIHVIDVAARQVAHHFAAGVGVRNSRIFLDRIFLAARRRARRKPLRCHFNIWWPAKIGTPRILTASPTRISP